MLLELERQEVDDRFDFSYETTRQIFKKLHFNFIYSPIQKSPEAAFFICLFVCFWFTLFWYSRYSLMLEPFLTRTLDFCAYNMLLFVF